MEKLISEIVERNIKTFTDRGVSRGNAKKTLRQLDSYKQGGTFFEYINNCK